MANEKATEAWNGEGGQRWADEADRYDTLLQRYTPRLMAGAALRPGERVLDLGCGCGQTSLVAAATVGESGQVTGVDISGPMLATARGRADGQRNVTFRQADVQQDDLGEGAYDIAISRFGVMFFDDPDTAFTRVHRALAPGGRLAFACWRDPSGSEYYQVPRDAIAPYTAPDEPEEPGAPGPHSLADPDRVRTLLSGAGFTDIALEPVDESAVSGTNAEDAAAFRLTSPSFAALLKDASQEDRSKAAAALRTALTPYETPNGVLLRAPAWVVTAHR
ncbi:class I SAM-dependent methyltransferase [Streptomyces boninensis]|uniref:class I SAM-dependent methyltransferase n=1 Tax=Streptomyces boninensis TaxID=2039455 RepID=UPI003B228D10